MKHLILTILFTLPLFSQEVGVPFALLSRGDVKTTALASTKDGKIIFSATTGVIHRIELNPIKVSFSVYVGSDDKRWTVYPPDGKPYQAFSSNPTTVNHIVIAPNEQFIVTCGSDKLLKAWDVQSGKPLQTFVGHDSPVKGAVILSDNKTLISSDENMTIKYWDISSGKEIKSMIVYSHMDTDIPKALHNLYLSKDEKTLIAYHSHDIVFMDTQSGEKLTTFSYKGRFEPHASYFYNNVLYILKDMKVIQYDIEKYDPSKDSSKQYFISDPKKDYRREDIGAILNSCIINENDILTILIHSRNTNNEDDLKYTSPPLVIGKVKVYGANYGRVIIDRCPIDNNQIMIKPLKKNWLAITSDGYFNSFEDALPNAKDYLYIKNDMGKVLPIDEKTYQKYHKTLTMEEK
jgi:WD40 repeat protein